ncbi:MAG TPA: DMT family transporter [Burkholderiales bacterium]|nr:DMT family transporter [Burkholderiales bacterium]
MNKNASASRGYALLLLALASLLWAGNWVLGRALRDLFEPVALNFWRWLVAAVALAPFAWPRLRAQFAAARGSAGLLFVLAFLGVALFQTLVYAGLKTTTAVNAVLLNSSMPAFMLLCSWAIERERGTPRQVAGMLISLAGILVILARGEAASLARLEFHSGDALILLAMPVWGVYSVLLKRRPPGLDGIAFLFAISLIGAVLLLPAFALEAWRSPPRWPGPEGVAAALYVGLAASVCAFICWNRGVAIVGANTAGFTVHLLPAFGTLLAIAFLGESFRPYHALGIATILLGVVVATRRAASGKAA